MSEHKPAPVFPEGWVVIDHPCYNCGCQLAAKRDPKGATLLIEGLEPLLYRHAENGNPACHIVAMARPYDLWKATREYRRATAEEPTTPKESTT